MRLSIQKSALLFTTVALGCMLGGNAQDLVLEGYEDTYTFKQEWKSEAVPKSDEILFTDYRQGFGQNNQFYIQNKNANGQKIEIYNQNGYVGDFADSGLGSNITKDEAGNIIVRTGQYARPYTRDKNFRIIKADGSQSIDLTLPSDCSVPRGDYWGFANGDVFSAQGGKFAFSGSNQDNFYLVEIKSGQVVSGTKVTLPYLFGLNADMYFSSDGIVNSWKDANGNQHYLAINSNENPIDIVLDENNTKVTFTTIAMKSFTIYGTCTGANCFAFNGKNYIMFSTQPNWNDGFVIAELGTNDDGTLNGAISVVAQHVNDYTTPMGDNVSSKCDWLNWEPRDEKSIYVYQYFPGYYMARYIFGIETDDTPLETIVNDGTVGETYTIADDILGVYIAVKDPTKVYAKDYGKHRHPSKPEGEQIDFIKINTTLESKNEWDQSNWVLLDFGSEEEANKYVGKVIKGGTLTGELTNKLNPTMTVTKSIEPEETGEYVENNYVASNFMTPNVQTGIEWHGTTGDYFFVEPKPQEYVKVNWALFDGNVGDHEHFSLKTTSDFKGSFNVDWSLYPGTWQEDFKEGKAYNFHAIVRYTRTDGTMQSPLKAENSATEGLYMVFPLEGGDGLITGIDEVAGDAQVIGVTYVNVMGMQSLKPWPGINIVVTRYSNGTTQVRKELHR
jgi:hypothetical protein